jgi:tetratricopeptide (TPR) repeat protein
MGVRGPAIAALLGAALLAFGAPAAADRRRDERARVLYAEGKKAYETGEYQTAYDRFNEAYCLSQAPALLYDLASALQGLTRPHDAAEALRAYLRALPDDPDRPQIETRIRTLEEAQRLLDIGRSRSAPVERARADLRARPPRKPGRAKTMAALAVGAAGFAALGGGIACGVLAQQAAQDVRNLKMFDPAVEQRGKTDDILSGVFYAVGGAALVSGVVLYAVGSRESKRTGTTLARLVPDVGGSQATLRFDLTY